MLIALMNVSCLPVLDIENNSCNIVSLFKYFSVSTNNLNKNSNNDLKLFL